MALPLTCVDCGYVLLKDVVTTPCPKCRSKNITQLLVPPPAVWRFKGNAPDISTVRKVWEISWPFFISWLIVQAGGLIASYFTNQWVSVGLSLAVAIATFILGLCAISRVLRRVTLSGSGTRPAPL